MRTVLLITLSMLFASQVNARTNETLPAAIDAFVNAPAAVIVSLWPAPPAIPQAQPNRALFEDAPLRGVSTAGLPTPLKEALARVQSSCNGFTVISGFRKNARVRGSGRRSLHADWKAADFKVSSYPCAYAALKGFRGGISTDPGAVHHIHISWAPQGHEWGRHFAHYSPHRHVRYARHHRHYRTYAKA